MHPWFRVLVPPKCWVPFPRHYAQPSFPACSVRALFRTRPGSLRRFYKATPCSPARALRPRTKRAGLNAQLSIFIAGGLRPELSRVHFAYVRFSSPCGFFRTPHGAFTVSCFAVYHTALHLSKHYLLYRFAFGFRLLAGLNCSALSLACQSLLSPACFRLRVQAFACWVVL